MKLSLVIPCYNEEGNVELFYESTVKALQTIINDVEFIFINDGSKDQTMTKLTSIVDNSPYNVNVINFSRNFGKEAALLAGLEASEGDYVSIIDADMQQRPEYVLQMLDFLEENPEYDEVAMVQDTRKESKVLVFFKNCFYKIINRMTEVEIVRSASDFRTLNRDVVNAIVSLPENCRFSKGIFSWVGFNIKYLPYEVEDRASGTSKWSFWKLFAYAIDGITAFSTAPLTFLAVLGSIICFGSCLSICWIFIKSLIWQDPVRGFPTLAIIVLFAMGIQLLSVGIIGQYLAKTYIETKGRPMYVVKKVLKSKDQNHE